MRRSAVRSSVVVSLDHLETVPPATLRKELQRLTRTMVFGTLAERGRRCGKPTCRCVDGEKHPALQLAHWAGDGKTRSLHVPYRAGRRRARRCGRVASLPGDRPRTRRSQSCTGLGPRAAPREPSDDATEAAWSVVASVNAACGKWCCPMPANSGRPTCGGSTRCWRTPPCLIRSWRRSKRAGRRAVGAAARARPPRSCCGCSC